MTEARPGCCAPSAGRESTSTPDPPDLTPAGDAAGSGVDLPRMVPLAGGEFLMGSEDERAYPDDGEGPVRREVLEPFRISATVVTNAQFAAFVTATGHRTDAERYGWSFVFGGLLPDDFPPTRGVVNAPWWRQVEGADWRHPAGPFSDVDRDGLGDHPVVHVSWSDAAAYCVWAGLRLPTEREWEFAARGGLEGQAFPWGDELEPGGEHRMNVWQGVFPQQNTESDGWYGTCPAHEYPPNGFGLYNMTGNVWEWCQDRFEAGPPTSGTRRSARGGSYLCHDSYCRRYRVSARQGITPDSSMGNTGFRCAGDA